MNNESRESFDARLATVKAVIEEARADLAMWLVATGMDESADVVEEWEQRIYDRLEALPHKELALAAVFLLCEKGEHEAEANSMLKGIR